MHMQRQRHQLKNLFVVLLHAMPCRFASMIYPLAFEVKAVAPTVFQLGPFGPA